MTQQSTIRLKYSFCFYRTNYFQISSFILIFIEIFTEYLLVSELKNFSVRDINNLSIGVYVNFPFNVHVMSACKESKICHQVNKEEKYASF